MHACTHTRTHTRIHTHIRTHTGKNTDRKENTHTQIHTHYCHGPAIEVISIFIPPDTVCLKSLRLGGSWTYPAYGLTYHCLSAEITLCTCKTHHTGEDRVTSFFHSYDTTCTHTHTCTHASHTYTHTHPKTHTQAHILYTHTHRSSYGDL